MKPLLFLFLSSLVIGLHARSTESGDAGLFVLTSPTAEIDEWMKELRNGGAGERIRLKVEGIIQSSYEPPLSTLLSEVNRKAIAIFDATVPMSANPTPAKLKELSGDLAQSVRKIDEDKRSKRGDDIFAIASNTALLTATEEASQSNQSPSKFANALKQSSDSDHLYTFAAYIRCIVDKRKDLPKLPNATIESDVEEFGKHSRECLDKRPLQRKADARFDEIGRTEILEFFSSQKNVESVVNDFWLLMKAIKKASSYESKEAFFANIEGSRRLKAIVELLSEGRRCVQLTEPENLPLLEKFRFAFLNTSKRIFGEEEESEETLRLRNLEMILYIADLEPLMKKFPRKQVGPGSNFWKCMMPASLMEQIVSVKPVFNGVEADEAKTLLEVAQKSSKAHSFLVLFYEHLHALRNRHGMNQEANTFLTQAFNKLIEYRKADGSTEAGKAIQARAFAELRSSFIGLSNDTKKIFAHHFPHRTVALLSALF